MIGWYTRNKYRKVAADGWAPVHVRLAEVVARDMEKTPDVDSAVFPHVVANPADVSVEELSRSLFVDDDEVDEDKDGGSVGSGDADRELDPITDTDGVGEGMHGDADIADLREVIDGAMLDDDAHEIGEHDDFVSLDFIVHTNYRDEPVIRGTLDLLG